MVKVNFLKSCKSDGMSKKSEVRSLEGNLPETECNFEFAAGEARKPEGTFIIVENQRIFQ